MSLLDVLGHLTVGLRFALTLFAAMSLLSPPLIGHPVGGDVVKIDLWRARAANMLAWAILLYSPAHGASLMGHPAPPLMTQALDASATGLSCACFIHLLAARALKRGVSMQRVRRGVYANIMVLTAFLGAPWLIR